MTRNRSGFTLLELIVVVAIMAGLGMFLMTKVESTNFNSQVSKLTDQLTKIIYNGVIDPITGYANGTGGVCSASHDYKDISAYRVANCANLNLNVVELDNSPSGRLDGTKSKIMIFGGYTKNSGALLLDEDTSDASNETFKILIDLSTLTVSPKRVLFLEDMIVSNFQREFSTSLTGTYRKATSLVVTTGGNDMDGLILFTIKK